MNFDPSLHSPEPYQVVDHESHGESAYGEIGILYIVVHFNRSHHFELTYSSIIKNLQNTDALWVIDHGSDSQSLNSIANIIHQTKQECNAPIYVTKLNPNIPGAQYVWLMKQLLRQAVSLPSHYMLLGDDDYLLPGFREAIFPLLNPSNTISVGFGHHDSISLAPFAPSREFTSSIIQLPGETEQWITASTTRKTINLCLDSLLSLFPLLGSLNSFIRSLANKDDRTIPISVQQHPSATINSIKALEQANLVYADLFPMPYSDVGNILINSKAQRYHLDRNLVSIGIGVNFGMTPDIFKMKANHFCPCSYKGLPSHKKFLAITSYQVLSQLKSKSSAISLSPLLIAHVFEVSIYMPLFLLLAIRNGPIQVFRLLADYMSDLRYAMIYLLFLQNRESCLLYWMGLK